MKDNITNSYKRSFLIGLLLGDAHVRKCSRALTAEWTVSHRFHDTDLVVWKRDEIVRLFNIQQPSIHIRSNGNGKKKTLFSFTAGGQFRIIYQWFKKDGRKAITPKIRFMDHPIGIAMLLCDDGSIRKRKKFHRDGALYFLKPSITIATHCFSREEVERLLVHLLNTFGIQGYINLERRIRCGSKREYPRINFNVENSRKLWELAVPFIPKIPSMNAKFSYTYKVFGQ